MLFRSVSVTLGGSGGGGGDDPRWAYLTPAAPTNVAGTAGNAQVALTWTAPSSVAPITDYVVQYSSNSGTTWTTFSDGTSTAASATVTGLTNGTAYTFRVAAVSGIGQGAWSSASSSVLPVGGDPFYSSVSLLLHMDGTNGSATITDNSPSPATITSNGNATITTANKRFGTGSLALNSQADYLTLAKGSRFTFEGDFVIEAFVNCAVPSAFAAFIEARSGATAQMFAFGLRNVSGTMQLEFYDGVNTNRSGTAVAANTWSHVAFVRTSGTLSFYINGSKAANTFSIPGTIAPSSSSTVYLGALPFDNLGWSSGFLDEFRITNGSNRGYTGSTITVPTAAFPDS